MEQEPRPFRSRWNVWTDSEAQSAGMGQPLWFWAASGPRGHMSGAEREPTEAIQRAWGAYRLLHGEREAAAS